MITSFALIFGGMFLTRPDRSIPPYTVGAKEGAVVAVNVPSWTSDSEIETLIRRFGKVGRETQHFGPMKIQPTTPGDPKGLYSRIVIYVFSDDQWTQPDVFHEYMTGDDQDLRRAVAKAVRGTYRLDESGQEGRIGPLLEREDSAATAAYSRVLFKGPVNPGKKESSGTSAQAGADQAS